MSDLSYMHPQLRPLAVPVADLVPDPRNARRRDERALSALKASIESNGFRSVIIVQKDASGQHIIRAGNGRHQAVTELGYSHIPALVFEEGDDAAVEFAIADNRTAELAEWDFEVLGKHLEELGKADEFDIEKLGFTDNEIGLLTTENLWEDADEEALDNAGERVDLSHGADKPKAKLDALTIRRIGELYEASGYEGDIGEWVLSRLA